MPRRCELSYITNIILWWNRAKAKILSLLHINMFYEMIMKPILKMPNEVIALCVVAPNNAVHSNGSPQVRWKHNQCA